VTGDSAWRRAGPAAGYLAILAVAGLVWRARGAAPFASDASPVQLATGLLFALAGVAAWRLPALSFPARLLLTTAGAWLAVDEWLMVHECLKFGLVARFAEGRWREVLVVGYAAAGAVTAALVARRVKPPRDALAHGAFAALAVSCVLSIDVAGLVHGPVAEVLEETAELLAAWGAIQCCAAAARAEPSAPWREAVAVGAWSVTWLGGVVWLLKPLFCAQRFL
jgi:hypothetical protein